MSRIGKKIFALLLASTMICGSFSGTAYAEEKEDITSVETMVVEDGTFENELSDDDILPEEEKSEVKDAIITNPESEETMISEELGENSADDQEALPIVEDEDTNKTVAASCTREAAVSWMQSQVGKQIETDGAYYYQCVDLIQAYYQYLGVSRVSGNGKDYAWNSLPDGWQRIEGASPQPGDILVYTTGQWGHVALYESDYATYHQNYNGHSYVEKITSHYQSCRGGYWGVIRPDFQATVAPSNATISKNQYWYDIGDQIEITVHADGATSYYMSMFKDDVRIAGQNIENGYYSLSASAYGIGHYSAAFSCSNSAGTLHTEWIDFDVVGVPGYSDVRASSWWYDLADEVAITVDTICAKGQFIGIDKEGVGRVITEQTEPTYKMSASSLGVGKYSAYFSVYNGSGSIDTRRVEFEIADYPKGTLLDLGDSFSSRIQHVSTEKLLTNQNNENVYLDSFKNELFASQIWKFTKNEDGSYKIKSSIMDKAFDVDNAKDEDGTNVKLYNNYSTVAQNWFIYQHEDGSIFFRSALSVRRVLNLTSGSTDDGTNVQLWDFNGSDAQKFRINKCNDVGSIGDDFSALIMNTVCWKAIMIGENEKCILAAGSSKDIAKQLWHFEYNSDGSYYIKSYFNNKYLDVSGGSDCNGTPVGVWDSNSDLSQKWFLVSTSEGFILKSACCDRIMDVAGGSEDDGTPIQLWESNGSSAQRFSIYSINGERDKISYSLRCDKTQLEKGEKATVFIENAPYAIDYKLYIHTPTGAVKKIELRYDNSYEFQVDEKGTYNIYAEVSSPVSHFIGSETSQNIQIEVKSTGEVPEITSIYANKDGLAASQTRVKISWKKLSDADGYQIYRAESKDGKYTCIKTITDGKATSYTNGNLKLGQTYYYKLRSYVEGGNGRNYSDFSEVNYTPASVVIDSIYSNASNRLRLIWKEVQGTDGYQIWRADSENGTYKIVKTIKSGDTTAYSNVLSSSDGSDQGKTYYYKMRAYTTSNGNKIFGAYSSVTPVSTMPVTPSVKVESTKRGSAKLSWEEVPGAAGYQIWRSDNKTGKYTLVKSITDGNISSYNNSGLISGQSYYYKVRAYTEVNGKKTFGEYCDILNLKIK